MSAFEAFQKIPRLNRGIVVTEKIDGTNAQVCIEPADPVEGDPNVIATVETDEGPLSIRAGSRKRWITPRADNFGFARWVEQNATDLAALGEGRHFGEWWGLGIQRGYGLTEKRFSLFNTARWADERPACCSVVPVLYVGLFGSDTIDEQVDRLRTNGSVAAPGFMHPEGVVVYHVAARTLMKVTVENDETPKALAEQETAA